jgi:gamma-glutamyltranspeptidase / glutathione hydrolase
MSFIRRLTVVMTILLFSGLLLSAQQPDQGPKPIARGTRAMASTSHPLVTRTMLDVMRNGGNAVDAAIAAVILQPILEPQMSTLAGGMSMMIYEAKTGRVYYLDAELDHSGKDAPIGFTMAGAPNVPETSGRRIGVPGTVAGLYAASQKFGTLKWADYFQPAIRLAEQGYPMYSFLYADMADAALTRLSAYESGRAEYLPEGFVPPVGATVKRPRLAQTLRRIAADGPDYFYKGEWARRFVEAVQKTGGSLSLDDLARYEARWEEPVRTTFRGVEVVSSPPPATAGTLIGMILNILEPYDLRTMPHFSESSRTLALVRQAFGLAETLSETYVRDPRGSDVPTAVLLSKPFAASLSKIIDAGWPLPGAANSNIEPQAGAPGADPASPHDAHTCDTNHLVVVDPQGNWVSLTHTIYGSTFATGLVVDGVNANSGNGFPGSSAGAGRRVISPFPPTMLFKDGKPWVTIGSPGLSSRTVALTLVNFLGFGMDLEKAIDAPRFQGSRHGETFLVESRVSEQARRELASLYGVNVQTTAPYNWHFGSIHAVMRDEKTGGLIGLADPRRGGHAEGY